MSLWYMYSNIIIAKIQFFVDKTPQNPSEVTTMVALFMHKPSSQKP